MSELILKIILELIVSIAMLDGDFNREQDQAILNVIPNVCIWEDATYSEGEC